MADPQRPRRSAILARATTGLLTGIAVLAACGGSSGAPKPPPLTSQQLAARVAGLPLGPAAAVRDQPPVVPSSGSLFGSWAQPTHYTQTGRTDAVNQLELTLGRRLDIVHTYRRENESFPTESDDAAARGGSYLMLSWAFDDAQRLADGQEDAFIDQRAAEIKRFGYPMFVEPQWEMDRPNLAGVIHSPAIYVSAWKRIHDRLAADGVTNVSWVWCPTAAGFANGSAPAYYPGSNEVDWVCADAYPGNTTTPLQTLLAPFLSWAASVGKPVMIGEFGINEVASEAARATWLTQAQAALAANPLVKAVVYFDSGVRSTEPREDFRPTDQPAARAAFMKWAANPHFDPNQLSQPGATLSVSPTERSN